MLSPVDALFLSILSEEKNLENQPIPILCGFIHLVAHPT